jgi:hypothetical protein
MLAHNGLNYFLNEKMIIFIFFGICNCTRYFLNHHEFIDSGWDFVGFFSLSQILSQKETDARVRQNLSKTSTLIDKVDQNTKFAKLSYVKCLLLNLTM